MSKNNKKKKAPRIKLIYNPGAGDNTGTTARLEQVTRSLQDQGFKVDVALAHPKEKATPIARKAAKAGYKMVVAFGGDGTIEAIARGLVKTKTYLGILPGGTYNNIAKSLGIPEDLDEACALIGSGQKRRLDVGQVKSKKKGKFYFFELVAIGLTAALYPEAKDIPDGKLDKVVDLVKTFVHYEVPKVSLKMDGESQIREKTMLVTVANTPAFGVTFLVAPQASLEDGLLDISLYPGFSKPGLLAHFARIAKGGTAEEGQVERYQARKLTVKATPKLEVMADGEMLGKGKVKIRILPGALRVIAPPEGAGLAQVPPAEDEKLPTPVAPAPPDQKEKGPAPEQPVEEPVASVEAGNGVQPVEEKE